MSASAYPRIYFSGHNYWNPSTYNNDDYAGEAVPLYPYCATDVVPTWQTFLARHGVNRENFKDWSLTLFALDKAGQQRLPPPEWNYFGGNQCGFVTADTPSIEQPQNFSRPEGPENITVVRGFTNSAGEYHNGNDSKDPWLAQPLQFSPAKLVDVNPTVPFSSQIFGDQFVLGTSSAGFSAPITHRMYSRWIGPHNLNVDGGLMIAGPISCVFQTCFENGGIRWNGGGALQDELKSASQAPGSDGVMLRFVTYDTFYFNGPAFPPQSADQFPSMEIIQKLYVQYYEQLEQYEQGKISEAPQPPCNRAYSRVVGWIAPWRAGELATMPGGRFLLSTVLPGQPGIPNPKQPNQPLPLLPPNVLTPKYLDANQQPLTSVFPFGPAAVERVTSGKDVTRIAVDLGSTVPELDSTGTIANYGKLELGFVPPGSQEPTIFATLVDDTSSSEYHDTYHRYSGIVDVNASQFQVPVTQEQFDNNPLVLRATNYTYSGGKWSSEQQVALTENPLNAQTDTRGVYVNQPTVDGPTAEFDIQVRLFGKPLDQKTGLAVIQYDRNWQTPTANTVTDSLPGAGVAPNPRVQLFYKVPGGAFVPIDNSTLVDAGAGSVTIGVRGLAPGIPVLTFFPIANQLVQATPLSPEQPIQFPPPAIAFSPPSMSSAYYTVVRVLPFKDQQAMNFLNWLQEAQPDSEMVSDKVFAEIYQTYYLMYPVMSFIDSPAKFQQMRRAIMQVTDPKNFESAGYMPVMRSWSAGERRIMELYNEYLDSAPKSTPKATPAFRR